MFSKILVANRGEIAVRIIRACKEMGIKSVAVYSEADKDSLHVKLADECVFIGGNSAEESYLKIPSIISAAIAHDVDAIHPGYGLLSENHKFVKLCNVCDIKFIGPNSDIIKKMGDKDEARKTMISAGVPVIEGCGVVEDIDEAREMAINFIGFPLLIKARDGVRNRGTRLVKNEEDFDNAFISVSRQAEADFGDGAVYMEKFLKNVKHIEMQILADQFSNVICLGERDCSIQRKNQKL
ncbi:MAG: biotin carboxylase N-terminal domain-containing protein, partial [Oscillospiraceae bacterium]